MVEVVVDANDYLSYVDAIEAAIIASMPMMYTYQVSYTDSLRPVLILLIVIFFPSRK